MIKRLYWAALGLYQKKTIEPTIRKFDKDSPVQLNSLIGNPLMQNGYIHFESWLPDADYFPESRPPEQNMVFDDFGIGVSREINSSVASILSSAIGWARNYIIEYLGEDARLDDACLFYYNPQNAKQLSISGSWHDDNVGHRLKMFICLKGDGSTPTLFQPGTHRNLYRFRLSDVFRFFGISSARSEAGEVFLRYNTGDVALFDTNGLHRGHYEEPSGERLVIVAEFINRHKSNRISGKAPCGPGSTPLGKVMFDADAFGLLEQTGMIDKDLVARDSLGNVCYSLSNSSRLKLKKGIRKLQEAQL